LHDDQAREHQGAAEQVARAEPLAQRDVTRQGREDGFETHHDGCVRGRGGSLADDLECEGDTG